MSKQVNVPYCDKRSREPGVGRQTTKIRERFTLDMNTIQFQAPGSGQGTMAFACAVVSSANGVGKQKAIKETIEKVESDLIRLTMMCTAIRRQIRGMSQGFHSRQHRHSTKRNEDQIRAAMHEAALYTRRPVGSLVSRSASVPELRASIGE
ncbi:hypothetical protein C8R44DRAFT_745953 [Mycena epipterygia]|nr:hypothetical protein C8R44DRAFT_745953 [Mycena epipterygia]